MPKWLKAIIDLVVFGRQKGWWKEAPKAPTDSRHDTSGTVGGSPED